MSLSDSKFYVLQPNKKMPFYPPQLTIDGMTPSLKTEIGPLHHILQCLKKTQNILYF
jgi:hypothetical protein